MTNDTVDVAIDRIGSLKIRGCNQIRLAELWLNCFCRDEQVRPAIAVYVTRRRSGVSGSVYASLLVDKAIG